MKTLVKIFVAVGFIAGTASCERYADDYMRYLEGREIVYPGLARNVHYRAGNLRTVLVWTPSPDPNIDHYVVTWNNSTGSVTVDATTHDPADSISVSIPGLDEYIYSFVITAYDSEGNASIGQEVNNVRVYGPAFQSVLLNRAYRESLPYEILDDGSLRLNFSVPDTMNVATLITYTNQRDEEHTISLLPDDNTTVISDYKFGTSIHYRSGYIPEPNAADTFFTASSAEFPAIYHAREVDKSLFNQFDLPGDAGTEWGWLLPYAWDKNTDEPGYHTPDVAFPSSFTFDMGRSYSLTQLKIWQRMSALYNHGNPKTFEVWGSNDPKPDGSWDSWTLLGSFTTIKPSGLPVGENNALDEEVARNGDPYIFSEPTVPVRYIRFRVSETWGQTVYFHILELSLYHNSQ